MKKREEEEEEEEEEEKIWSVVIASGSVQISHTQPFPKSPLVKSPSH